MAKYLINGSTFEVDDSIQGDALQTTLQQTADYTANQNQQKFLAFLGKAEGAEYDTIVGGRQKMTHFKEHPNIVGLRTKDGPSTAAGRYQITGTTYRDVAPQLGITDFSPESQDKVALHLISQKGAMDDVTSGNFKGAISKLGGVWASLPSSKYLQGHRTQEWVDKELGLPMTPMNPTETPQGYQPFGTVIKKVDQAKLNTNADWLKASALVYQMKERKQFKGTESDLADWSKSVMGYFNNNVVAMTADAAQLAKYGTPEEKNAFLYLMDQYDETKISWDGAGRAALGMVTDPINLVGLGTLGTATIGKIAASVAAKEAIKKTLLTSLGRTGIQAGILGGAQGGLTETIKQTVEVTGGRQDSVDLGKVAGGTAIGAVAGITLGTVADSLITVASPVVKKVVGKIFGGGKKGAPQVAPTAPPVTPSVVPEAPPATSPLAAPNMSPEGHLPPSKAASAADTLPISTVLTVDELKAAGTRAQKGRLWTDDFPTDYPLNQHLTAKLVIPDSTPGLKATVRNMAKLTEDGEKVTAQLRVLDDKDLRQTLEVLRNVTTVQDAPVVFRAVQILHDEMRVELATLMKKIQAASPDNLGALIAKKDALEDRLIAVTHADDAMGSAGGSLNRQRLEGLVGLQGSTPESLMLEKGISREAAEKLYSDMIGASQVSSKAKQIAGEYEMKIAEALEAGKLDEVAKLSVLKGRELAGIAEEAAPGGAAWRHKFAAGLKEFIISNIFTMKTVLINLVPAMAKTLAIPTLKYLATNPLERSARAELGAHYAALGSTIRGALFAAQAAYKYEQSILTRDASRLLEGEMVMTGKLGGWLRMFPRMLNATDELLAQINYAGFVQGKAANKAAIDGQLNGLKGKALDDYIKDAVTSSKATMYEEADEAMVQPIINKGVNLGYSGDELLKYVEKEAMRSPDALRHGTDKEALDLVRDVLYKRAFSGKGMASSGAQSLETFIHKNPSFALLAGQLFFRTPIRVFEEGIRMTPGVQLLAPKFLDDLKGVNGVGRQARAQAEAMTGLALTGSALALYASGTITGSGSYGNYKMDKTRKDGPGQEPYTIRFSDGSTWSYKNLDPIATPLKILVNAFEGMDKLKIKEAQEGFEMKEDYRLLQARVYVGLAAVTTAITDANLVAGAKGTMDLFAELADPSKKEDAILKKVGSELALLVPNTLHKVMQMNDPRMRDPATFFQVLEAKLGHGYSGSEDVKSSFAYDPLGQVRQMADIGSMWNIFSTSTQEERIRGNSEAHQQVMVELDRITQQTGALFTAPTPRHKLTGSLDLRTMLTEDKSETMYDRWQRNYREMKPDEILLPIIKSAAPLGTFGEKGIKTELIQSTISDLQDMAFQKMLTDERIRDRMIKEYTMKAKAQNGLLDFDNVNK